MVPALGLRFDMLPQFALRWAYTGEEVCQAQLHTFETQSSDVELSGLAIASTE
jgi:hypothetical protein